MKYLLIALMVSPLHVFAGKVVVEIKADDCMSCAYRVKNNFKDLVDDADRDVVVDANYVTVNLNQNVSNSEVRQRVTKAGYTTEDVTWVSRRDVASRRDYR